MSSYYDIEPWNDGGSNLMLKMLDCLPKFGGAFGEDPVKHTQTFHSICGRMKPRDESLEGFKLKCFKFSLTDFALDWYDSSCADYESNYWELRARFLEEFCPPSLRLETREKILNLEQFRDETLDEYLAYFDSIVASCPHHGFTRFNLIQRFLGGMMPLERKRLNDVAGCSLMELTVTEAWRLINDLAKNTKQGQWHQTDDKAPTMEVDSVQNEPDTTPIMSLPATKPREDISTRAVMDVKATLKEPILEPTEPTKDEESWMTKEELPKSGPVLITNLPKEVPALLDEPNEVPDFTTKPAETYLDLAAELTEKITASPVLTEELLEKGPVLMAEKPLHNPSCSIKITATRDEMINDDAVLGELKENHEPKQPTKELPLVTSQEEPLERCKDQGHPIISATKKRVSKGACLRSLGKRLNFQNCKDANRLYMKKRQRHGPKEWKPGRRSKRARLDGPAAMVKESSLSQGYVKKKPPDQGRAELSPLPYVFFGQIKRATEKKFDLKHPWDPTL